MIATSRLDIPLLRGPVPLSHLALRTFLQTGDRAVDATCGNGGDTLLLAELVGPRGKVWAFDIQQQAICHTLARLEEAGLAERVELHAAGHEQMPEHVIDGVAAVVFNLGYLPGGERTIITRPETTLAALEHSLGLLLPGGIVAITVYPGHDGGSRERELIETWVAGLAPRCFYCWRMAQMNSASAAPYFILIQKAA